MADIQTIVNTDTVNAALLTKSVNNFAALQNLFASASAPSSPVAFQLWLDTSTTPDSLKMRNAANSAWVTILADVTTAGGGLLPLTGGTMTGNISFGGTVKATNLANGTASADSVHKGQVDGRILIVTASIDGIAASVNVPLIAAPSALVISDCVIISDTATTGSDGSNNYTFQVANVTAGNNLRASAKSTNGAEIAANTTYALGLDQDLTLATSDVLRLVVTKTGSPASLSAAKIVAQVNYKVTT